MLDVAMPTRTTTHTPSPMSQHATSYYAYKETRTHDEDVGIGVGGRRPQARSCRAFCLEQRFQTSSCSWLLLETLSLRSPCRSSEGGMIRLETLIELKLSQL